MRLRTSLKLVAIVLPIVLAATACTPGKVHPPGALQHVSQGESVPADSWGISPTLAAGETMSVSITPFYNVRPYDITIDSVTPVDGDASLIVGVDVAGPNRNIGTGGGAYDSFPPVDPALGPLAPAAGFVIPANEPLTDGGYGLIVGIRGGGKSRALINGLHIIYEANGVKYACNEPVYIAVCGPPTAPGACKSGLQP
jgi:hypothetical protein